MRGACGIALQGGGSAEGVCAVRARMRSVCVAREHSPCEVQCVRQSRALNA